MKSMDSSWENLTIQLGLKGLRPVQWIKLGQTLSNTTGHNIFDLFEQHDQTCWIVLDEV